MASKIVNMTVATGTIVTVGRWSQGKKFNIAVIAGAIGVAVILSLMSQADEPLATKFGLLILLAALFVYMPAITKVLQAIWEAQK